MSTTTRHDTMRERAERLWPASPAMQARWLRAVELVRSTRRGWLLDQLAAKVGKA